MRIDNLIVIKGGAYKDIKKALRQWADLYSKDLPDALTFQLFKNGHGSHIIQADQRLDNERFYNLVNYLYNPEGIHYKINIEGFTTGRVDGKFKNKNLLVYVATNDKECNNIFATTSDNENFEIDFSGKISETNEKKIYRLPNDLTFNDPETLTIKNKPNIKKITEQKTERLTRRFGIITVIIIAAYVLTFLILNPDEYFMKANYTIAFAVWGWLVFDYKILQVDRIYFSTLALGISIFLYGYLLNHGFSPKDKSVSVSVGTTMPIFFLVLQRPLRFAFKQIMKREPIIDKPAPSFADFVYIFILLMSTLILPAFYYKK